MSPRAHEPEAQELHARIKKPKYSNKFQDLCKADQYMSEDHAQELSLGSGVAWNYWRGYLQHVTSAIGI
jgi:hypothetical protein